MVNNKLSKKALSKIGKKNPNWKGDNVGYVGLHNWVSRRLLKPKLCECGKRKPYDLANKGIYNRDLKNWEWLCRKCHMIKDGRIDNLVKMSSKKGEKNGRAKLNEKQVIKIFNLFKNKTNKEIANLFNVSPLTIWEIKTRKKWKHIKVCH